MPLSFFHPLHLFLFSCLCAGFFISACWPSLFTPAAVSTVVSLPLDHQEQPPAWQMLHVLLQGNKEAQGCPALIREPQAKGWGLIKMEREVEPQSSIAYWEPKCSVQSILKICLWSEKIISVLWEKSLIAYTFLNSLRVDTLVKSLKLQHLYFSITNFVFTP